ncbi:MAG TPA: tRNA (adenosine(37)-N6)-threonylcarbamoyltransferase complex dimerization subunit type 1 TsaB [Natronosporangium sp.]|nr:tRNA (adenosine(37)-N6)-threonylcarbamoyltransferase complex dimerization subunit type 1 TsaB [Natronosporangium sp.]
MLVLGLDTATPAVGAAVVTVDEQVTTRAWRRTVDPRAHAELLGPQIRAVLAEAGAGPADLAAIVAGTGPGPFTGLRVGLATAAAMGQALGVPTYGVCTLDAIAAQAAASVTARTLVATDARRRELYWAVYDRGARVSDPAVDPPAAVAKAAAQLGVGVAVGEGAHRYAADLGLAVLDEPRYPDPAALVRLAADRIRAGAPGERLTPRYLRRPDAAAPRPPKPVTPQWTVRQ